MTPARSDRTCRLVSKLSAYATAGAALGANDATAAVVYTDLGADGVAVANAFALDLNTDGQIDFSLDRVDRSNPRFCETTSSGDISCTGDFFFAKGLEVNARQSNRIHVSTRNTQVVVAKNEAIQFARGMMIRPAGGLRGYGFLAMSYRASTSSNGQCDFGGCYGYLGNFIETPRGYVGLVLDLPDGPHAAWADIEWRGLENPAVIFGFAYETEPDEPILAGAVPEPPSLVLLAAGAAGLAAFRRNRSFTP